MVNASRKAGLGRTLGRAQKKAALARNPRRSKNHTTELEPSQDNARLNLKSVTAQTNLDEFFEEAELAGKQFVTERRNVLLMNSDDQSGVHLYDAQERFTQAELHEPLDLAASLTVPRRPKWDSTTSPEELEERERLTFLAWRKRLAKLQADENIVLTPFEKNLEVWRQLWRVIERSDIVVQILDCRNPLLYICDDLIKYVSEAFGERKESLLLLNKADFLTLEQRRMWANYFKSQGLKAIFFSALLENENLKTSNRRASENENDENSDSGDDELTESDSDAQEANGERKTEIDNSARANDVAKMLRDNLSFKEELDDTHVYDKFELLDAWHSLLEKLDKKRSHTETLDSLERTAISSSSTSGNESSTELQKYPPTVGLVGYPNVGKSSTINALLSAKRVAVSATPGKTKHFQTFLIDRDMMLCDCPGLVFPNLVSSKSEMVISGVLPIDQMRDYVTPVQLIVERIPRVYLEEIYGLAFEQDEKQNISADDLLNAYGFMRGYMTPRGLPDISRASRRICKDYINGKILYCEPPPGADRRLYHSHSKLADAMRRIEERLKDSRQALRMTDRQRRLMVLAKGNAISAREFDAQFFQGRSSGAHIKALPGIGNLTQPLGKNLEVKVPKREKKNKKREKLRRVYRHLDE